MDRLPPVATAVPASEHSVPKCGQRGGRRDCLPRCRFVPLLSGDRLSFSVINNNMVDFFYCSIVIARLSMAVSLAAKENKTKQNKKPLYPRNRCVGSGSASSSVSELTASGGRDVRFTARPAFLPPQLWKATSACFLLTPQPKTTT